MPLFEKLNAANVDFRMLILPDHPTPVAKRTHTSEPVPFLLYDSTNPVQSQYDYSENHAKESGLVIEKGHELIDFLFEKQRKKV